MAESVKPFSWDEPYRVMAAWGLTGASTPFSASGMVVEQGQQLFDCRRGLQLPMKQEAYDVLAASQELIVWDEPFETKGQCELWILRRLVRDLRPDNYKFVFRDYLSRQAVLKGERLFFYEWFQKAEADRGLPRGTTVTTVSPGAGEIRADLHVLVDASAAGRIRDEEAARLFDEAQQLAEKAYQNLRCACLMSTTTPPHYREARVALDSIRKPFMVSKLGESS